VSDFGEDHETTVFKSKSASEEISVLEMREEVLLLTADCVFAVTATDLINIGNALLNIGQRIQEEDGDGVIRGQ
jgi:hypothetical protein